MLLARSFFRFLVTLTLSPFLNSPVTSFHCSGSSSLCILVLIQCFDSTKQCVRFPWLLTKMSSKAFYIIDSSWLNLPKKNVRVNLKQDKWFFDKNGFWYKRISVFRNIKEELPHVAYLNSWRNVPAAVTDCAPKKICCWIPALCCLPTQYWHCPPSLIGTSFHWSGSSSLCILLTSGKNSMKCWVFFYF